MRKAAWRRGLWAMLATLAVVATAAPAAGGAEAATARISVSSSGIQGDADSGGFESISADGRFVVFDSFASNLVARDSNGVDDVFVRDRLLGTTERVSVAGNGAQGNNSSAPGEFGGAVSADGRYVVFDSFASNLSARDRNGNGGDVFVRDRRLGTTTLASVSSAGTGGDDESDDGIISADGGSVVFTSRATNLAGGDANGGRADVFVHDLGSGVTRRVSVSSSGAGGNDASFGSSVSADGSVVAFFSFASNLVAGDRNHQPDVFVRDLGTGRTERVNVSSGGAQADQFSEGGSLSADGRFVVFDSDADNLVAGDGNGLGDAFVHDRKSGATTRVSLSSAGRQGNGPSNGVSISADGRFVAFTSFASNLVPDDRNHDADAMVRDRRTGVTMLAAVSSAGVHENGFSGTGTISADGRWLVFHSVAGNLVAGDTNAASDVFVHSLTGPAPPPTCMGQPATVIGSERDDSLKGSSGDDVILALAGNDTIDAGAGDDLICTDGGADVVNAGAGDDIVQAGPGDDRLLGAEGSDRLFGRWGSDRLFGEGGSDLLMGGKGPDTLDGGAAVDGCFGGPSTDTGLACEHRRGIP